MDCIEWFLVGGNCAVGATLFTTSLSLLDTPSNYDVLE